MYDLTSKEFLLKIRDKNYIVPKIEYDKSICRPQVYFLHLSKVVPQFFVKGIISNLRELCVTFHCQPHVQLFPLSKVVPQFFIHDFPQTHTSY